MPNRFILIRFDNKRIHLKDIIISIIIDNMSQAPGQSSNLYNYVEKKQLSLSHPPAVIVWGEEEAIANLEFWVGGVGYSSY